MLLSVLKQTKGLKVKKHSQYSKDLIRIGSKLQRSSFLRLYTLAQKQDLATAKRNSPIYWRNLNLEPHKEAIIKILKTTAPLHSDQWIEKVLEFQEKFPEAGDQDGILGPKTFRTMIKNFPNLFPNLDPDSLKQHYTEKQKSLESLKNLTRKSPEEIIEEYKMVDLSGVIPIKNYKFGHPIFIDLLKQLKEKGFPLWRITEAFPPTVAHRSVAHYEGRAIDITLKDPRFSEQVVNFINQIPGFKALDEYKNYYGGTAGHIHIEYKGK